MLIGIEAAHAAKDKRTGVEEYCWQIIQGLKKQLPRELGVVLYSHQELAGELGVMPPNWQIKVLRWPLKKMWSQLRLSWEFLFHPPDIFFAPGQLIPFFCPKNTVVMIHDSAFLAVPTAYRFWGRQYLKWMNRRIVKVAKIIITSSEFNKKELLKYYKISPEKVKVIPLAYDEKKYFRQEAGEEVLKKYGLTKPFIMSVGRLEEKKNTRRIIEAFNLIKISRDTQLLLVGQPGAGYEQVAEALQASPYKNDIILPGYVPDVPKLLNLTECFLFPSLYEGFGLPILEAFGCGASVVVSGGGALQEVGGGAALYVNPESVEEIAGAVLKILNDKDLKERQMALGLERVKNFSWEKTAAATARILL